MNDVLLEKIADQVGTPIFIYDFQSIRSSFLNLKRMIPLDTNIYYSMKANPTLAICQIIRKFTENVEVSSMGEMECALRAGFKEKNILFSGPGKTPEELAAAVKRKIKINIESLEELREIYNICSEQNSSANIMIRVNPDSSIKSAGVTMSGVPSQFGIDITEMMRVLEVISQDKRVNCTGISVFIGSQILDTETILFNTDNIIRLFLDIRNKFGLHLTELDVGGGFGVSYYDNRQLDGGILSQGMNKLFRKYQDDLKGVKVFFESGRYLLAESGSFITQILYVKQSKGKNYIICDGGFHNVLISAFFSKEIRGNFPISHVSRNTSIHAIQKEYYISGPLCTPKDIIGSKVTFSSPEKEDLIVIKKVGAYGLTFSPVHFISHPVPAEVIVNEETFQVIRSRSDSGDLFKNQIALSDGLLGEFLC